MSRRKRVRILKRGRILNSPIGGGGQRDYWEPRVALVYLDADEVDNLTRLLTICRSAQHAYDKAEQKITRRINKAYKIKNGSSYIEIVGDAAIIRWSVKKSAPQTRKGKLKTKNKEKK